MKKNILTKALCMILAFALCLTVISVPVMAEDTDISTQRNKIYGLKSQDNYKTDNNGYQSESESVIRLDMVVIGENLSASSLMYYDRNNYKFSRISEDMLGASFIRVVRNHSIFDNVDSSTPVTKTVEGQDPVTEDKFGGYDGKSPYGFRINNSLTLSPWYNGAFSAANGEPGYYEFYVSSDCTVVVADNAGHGYPNLDKSLWTKSDGKTHQIYNGKTTYYREYKAGSLVQIPNYGIGGNLADNTKVTYEYTDKDGNAKTYETTVGAANYSVFDDIAIAVKWANPISCDATLKSVTVGGKNADLSNMENNTLNIGVPQGSENLAFEVVTNDDYATVNGAPETVSIGDTIEFSVTAEAGNTENYVFNIVEESFDIEVDATDEYKALFKTGGYKGDHVIKKADAPTFSMETVGLSYQDENGFWKNRTYKVEIDGVLYTESDVQVFKYAKAMELKKDAEAEGKAVKLTAVGYNYSSAQVEVMVSSVFNTSGHNFGPIGSAFRNADFQILTHRAIAPGRVSNEASAFDKTVAEVQQWLTTDSNYIMKVKPNKKATVYVAMNQAGSKNHSQYIADEWKFIDSTSYFVSGRVDSLPSEAIIDVCENTKSGKQWYMAEPSYELAGAPYSFIKIQYDGGSHTQAQVYPYVWYKTVDAGQEILIPTVGKQANTTDQQPLKVFVIEGEHKEWTPTSTDTSLSEISYSIDSVVEGKLEATGEDTYTLSVPSNAEAVKISAKATEEDAVVEITQADLSADEKKAIITVTAPDNMFKKQYTVNINVLNVPFMNINSVDSFMSEENVYKLYDASLGNLEATSYNTTDIAEATAKREEYKKRIEDFNAIYGENAARGTSGWGTYPTHALNYSGSAVTGVRLDNPIFISSKNKLDAEFIMDGNSWVLKSTKGATPTAENVYSLGKNDEYLTFDVLKPGTMYVVDTNGWGYKGGLDNGYKILSGYKLGGCPVYYRHFDAGKVIVPAQDTDKYSIDSRQPNTICFVFMFDDEASTDVKSITYSYGNVKKSITFIERDTHLTPVEIKPDYAYTGDLNVTIDSVMEGTTVEVEGSVVEGNGTVVAKVKSKDGTQEKAFEFKFSYVKSSDATLKLVKADESKVEFDEDNSSTINLPYGSKAPVITYEINNAKATAVMETKDNVTTITVTAEDGVTVKVYTITFNFEEPKTEATITISTNGQEIFATIGANDKVSLGNTNTAVYEYGTNIELEAIAAEGQTFMYWKSGDAIVSENVLYGFVTGSERNIEAIFADADAYTIAFRSNGKIVAYGTVVETVPQNPYWAGYVFNGWYDGDDKTDLKAGDAIGEITESVTYRAGYTKSTDIYTVEVFNGENADALVYTKQYNDKIEVTASDVAEKEFAYWMRDGKIVSYNKTYTFYVSADTQLVANYTAEPAETAAVVITLAKPTQIGDSKLAYYAERNVDETYTVIESGILLDTVAEFDVNTAKVKAMAKNTNNAGQFTIRKANVTAEQQWYAKAYVIYQDAYGNVGIAYSELVGPDAVK